MNPTSQEQQAKLAELLTRYARVHKDLIDLCNSEERGTEASRALRHARDYTMEAINTLEAYQRSRKGSRA